MCICYSSTRCFKTLRCFKMNAIKLNCTLESVTKVSAQVVLFLAVLAWCSSALKRHKTDPNPSYIPGTKACQRLSFGSWRFETQSVLRSGLSTWSPQQLLWWIGGWGSRGWSWHLSSRPMLWCHGRDWSSMACHMRLWPGQLSRRLRKQSAKQSAWCRRLCGLRYATWALKARQGTPWKESPQKMMSILKSLRSTLFGGDVNTSWCDIDCWRTTAMNFPST